MRQLGLFSLYSHLRKIKQYVQTSFGPCKISTGCSNLLFSLSKLFCVWSKFLKFFFYHIKLVKFSNIHCKVYIIKFLFNFYCFIFKDFSHSYSSKLLSSFSGFSVAFLTKSHNCRHSSSIYLVSFSGWSISLFCDLNYVIFISFLFRFLIICFDSSHMIAAYFLHFSISFVLQQTFFQACSILF